MGVGPGVCEATPVPPNYERVKFIPRNKMAFQGERVPGGLDMELELIESMARDGSCCNYNPRESSTPYTEHGFCQQTESHNGGAIALQRSTEWADIFSATNGTTRGECFQPPLQTTWSWQARQADIGELWAQLEEEKREHELEIHQLKEIEKEQRLKQEKEINQLKKTMRLENEGQG